MIMDGGGQGKLGPEQSTLLGICRHGDDGVDPTRLALERTQLRFADAMSD